MPEISTTAIANIGIHTLGIANLPSAAARITIVKHRIVYTRKDRSLCCIQSAVSARSAIKKQTPAIPACGAPETIPSAAADPVSVSILVPTRTTRSPVRSPAFR